MKRIFIIGILPFLAAACFAPGSPSGSGAGLGSMPSPIESGGMAGPPEGSSSMSGASGGAGAAGGSGSGGEEDLGRGEPDAGPTDPTAGAETPVTVVGTPMGGARKPKDCPLTDFRLCFHNVTVTPQPGSAVDGVLTYDVSGILGTQKQAGDPVDPVWEVFVYLVDLLFPDVDHTTATQKPDGDFVATVTSPPGRALRLQIERCKHQTSLDITLPEENAPPIVLDPCGAGPPPSKHPMHPSKLDGVFDHRSQ